MKISMENIIQQIAIELVEKINKKAFSEKLTDLDKLAAEIFEDCTESAKLIVHEVVCIRNLQFEKTRHFASRKVWCLRKRIVRVKSSQSLE